LSESDEQKEIVAWFRSQWPQYALSLRVSQSGGYRGKGKQGAIRTAQVTAMGGVTGESDIAILLPRGRFGCLLIEHKAEGGLHKATPKQSEYLDYHNDKSIGNCACLTRGVDQAKAAITVYMRNPPPN